MEATATKQPTNEGAEDDVALWNAKYPVGTWIDYWLDVDEDGNPTKRWRDQTISEARTHVDGRFPEGVAIVSTRANPCVRLSRLRLVPFDFDRDGPGPLPLGPVTWNARYPVGTVVDYWENIADVGDWTKGRRTRTTSAARWDGRRSADPDPGTPVVSLKGAIGVKLSHLRVVPEGTTIEAPHDVTLWNAKHPIGTVVDCWAHSADVGDPAKRQTRTKTITRAWVRLSDRVPVIALAGIDVARLSCLRVVPDKEAEASKAEPCSCPAPGEPAPECGRDDRPGWQLVEAERRLNEAEDAALGGDLRYPGSSVSVPTEPEEAPLVAALRRELEGLLATKPMTIAKLHQIAAVAEQGKKLLQSVQGHAVMRGATGLSYGGLGLYDGPGGAIQLGPSVTGINASPNPASTGNPETYGATVTRELQAVIKSLRDTSRKPVDIIREMGVAKKAGLDDVYDELNQELTDLRTVKKRLAGRSEGLVSKLSAAPEPAPEEEQST